MAAQDSGGHMQLMLGKLSLFVCFFLINGLGF